MTATPITVEFGDPSFSAETVHSIIAEQQAGAEAAATTIDAALAEEPTTSVEVLLEGEIFTQLCGITLITGQTEAEVISAALGLYETYVDAKTIGRAVLIETSEGHDEVYGLFPGDE
jgi:hypothetical protein